MVRAVPEESEEGSDVGKADEEIVKVNLEEESGEELYSDETPTRKPKMWTGARRLLV